MLLNLRLVEIELTVLLEYLMEDVVLVGAWLWLLLMGLLLLRNLVNNVFLDLF